MGRLNIGVATLQDIRLTDNDTALEKDYNFFWKGKPPGEARIHVVGFSIKISLLQTIFPPPPLVGRSDNIISFTMSTYSGIKYTYSVSTFPHCVRLKKQMPMFINTLVTSSTRFTHPKI